MVDALVGADELDLVGEVHVPVDALDVAVHRVAAADVEQHADRPRGVCLVGEEVVEGLLDHAGVFLPPVAALAGLLGRAAVALVEADRPLEVAEGGMLELAHAVDLGLEVGGGARADVAGDAIDLGVLGVLVGRELRVHRLVAGLAAEGDRLGDVVGLVAAEGGQEAGSRS